MILNLTRLVGSFRFPVFALGVLAAVSAQPVEAQHSDITFGEADGKIVYKYGSVGRVFEGEFRTSGNFEQSTSNPGFSTDAGESFTVPPSSLIDYNVLGPLAYHDGTKFAPVPTGASITIEDVLDGLLTVDATTIGPVTGSGILAQANDVGGIHQHINFQLDPLSLDTSEYGAYGLLMQLTIHADSPVSVTSSDPFYLVFNFGLDEPQFDIALSAFAAQVPEPSSFALLGFGAVAIGCFRRRFASHVSRGDC